MHDWLPGWDNFAAGENITETIQLFGATAKPGVDADATPAAFPEPGTPGCAYIAADRWPAGQPPFCGAPVQPGSPYCTAHRRICTADPTSETGAIIAMVQDLGARAEPPPELAHLAPIALPEPSEEDEILAAGELPIGPHPDRHPEEEA